MKSNNTLESQYHVVVRALSLELDIFDLNIGFIFGFSVSTLTYYMCNLE